MRRDKKRLLITIISIVVVLVILIVGLILFFTTDFIKSDEELFFKYLAQNIEIVERYLEDPNKTTMEQLRSVPYVINSDIRFDLASTDSEIANQTTPPRNFSIEYTKNADPENEMDYSEAKVKYLTKELFTAKYAHDGDLHVVNGTNAITSSDVLNIYLGIENNNLKQLAQKLGVENTSNVPNKLGNISITNLLRLSEKEKEYIQDLLVEVVYSQIPKNKYYHNKGVTIEIDTKQVQTNSYGINLSNEEYKNLVVAVLNKISQDQTILNILLQKVMLLDSQTDMTIDAIKTQLQNKITEISINDFKDGMNIQVFESDGKIVRTQIERNSMEYYIFDYERLNNSIRTLISLNYTYTTTDDNTQQQENNNVTFTDDNYQIIEGSASGEPQEIIPETTTYNVKNIELAKQISGTENNMIAIFTFYIDGEKYTVSLQNKTEQNKTQDGFVNNIILIVNETDTTYFTVKANSDIKPSNNISVQELNETNSAVLNNRTPENISQLLTAIKAQLQRIYEQQMQVVKEVQEQENAQGLTQIDPNAAESNTITNRTDVVQ